MSMKIKKKLTLFKMIMIENRVGFLLLEDFEMLILKKKNVTHPLPTRHGSRTSVRQEGDI